MRFLEMRDEIFRDEIFRTVRVILLANEIQTFKVFSNFESLYAHTIGHFYLPQRH